MFILESVSTRLVGSTLSSNSGGTGSETVTPAATGTSRRLNSGVAAPVYPLVARITSRARTAPRGVSIPKPAWPRAMPVTGVWGEEGGARPRGPLEEADRIEPGVERTGFLEQHAAPIIVRADLRPLVLAGDHPPRDARDAVHEVELAGEFRVMRRCLGADEAPARVPMAIDALARDGLHHVARRRCPPRAASRPPALRRTGPRGPRA